MARERGVKGERWIVLHDGMPDHPKVEDLSDRAFRALVRLWCWCGRHLTDGRVTAKVWAKYATPSVRKELMAAGLVDAHDDGSVEMHDFLDWQRSSAEVTHAIEAKKTAGRQGNHQRWHVKEGRFDPACDLCTAAPDAPPNVSQNGSQVRSHVGSRNGRRDRVETETEVPVETGYLRAPDLNVVELHGSLRSPAAADIAPLRSATSLPSNTVASFPSGPGPTRSVNATT